MRDECGVYEQYGSAGEHQPQSSDEMERGRDGAGGTTDRVLSFDFRFRAETQLFLATCAQRAEKKNGLKV